MYCVAPLISAVTGHHGSPPKPGLDESLVSLQYDYGKEGINAAGEFVRHMRKLFGLPQEMPSLERRSRRASFAVAGVAVLADWIGSSQEWFPYCAPVQDLKEYWDNARQQAECAVEEAGVLPTASSRQLGYEAMIGSHAPSPMQEWARSIELPAGPALLMIEDETGSGKTEAAIRRRPARSPVCARVPRRRGDEPGHPGRMGHQQVRSPQPRG